MRYYIKRLFFVGFLAASTLAIAQNSQEEKFEQFKKEMDLSDAQVLKIKAIRDKYAAEKNELKRKLNELREKELAEIDRLYTPEQKAKLKQILERHRANKK